MTRTLGKYGPPAPQITIIRTFLFIHTLFIYKLSISKSIQTGASVSRASACCCSLLSAIHPNFLKPESRNKIRHARSASKSLKGTIICLLSTIFNHRLQIVIWLPNPRSRGLARLEMMNRRTVNKTKILRSIWNKIFVGILLQRWKVLDDINELIVNNLIIHFTDF